MADLSVRRSPPLGERLFVVCTFLQMSNRSLMPGSTLTSDSDIMYSQTLLLQTLCGGNDMS